MEAPRKKVGRSKKGSDPWKYLLLHGSSDGEETGRTKEKQDAAINTEILRPARSSTLEIERGGHSVDLNTLRTGKDWKRHAEHYGIFRRREK